MYKLKLGTSLSFVGGEIPVGVADYRKEFYDELKECKELGFDSIDFDYTGTRSYTAMTTQFPQLRKGLQAILDAGLEINGVHLPFADGDFDLADTNELKRIASVNYCEEAFKQMEDFKPNAFIFHSSGEPIYPEGREKSKEQLIKSLWEITGLTNVNLCMENLPRSCLANTAEETIEIVDSVPGIKVCVDVNHFLKEKPEDAILKIGSRIATTHISDCDFIDELHRLPGQSKINFMNVIGALEKVGYNGVFNYEVTRAWPAHIRCTLREIKENYDYLFEMYNQGK